MASLRSFVRVAAATTHLSAGAIKEMTSCADASGHTICLLPLLLSTLLLRHLANFSADMCQKRTSRLLRRTSRGPFVWTFGADGGGGRRGTIAAPGRKTEREREVLLMEKSRACSERTCVIILPKIRRRVDLKCVVCFVDANLTSSSPPRLQHAACLSVRASFAVSGKPAAGL